MDTDFEHPKLGNKAEHYKKRVWQISYPKINRKD